MIELRMIHQGIKRTKPSLAKYDFYENWETEVRIFDFFTPFGQPYANIVELEVRAEND